MLLNGLNLASILGLCFSSATAHNARNWLLLRILEMGSWNTVSTKVGDIIWGQMPLADLIRLRRTNRATKEAVDSFLGSFFSTEKCLESWFTPGQIKEIRTFQGTTGLCFSGSAVLALVCGMSFTPNDLDCYVPVHHFNALSKLLHRFGYSRAPCVATTGPAGYDSSAILDTVEFVRSVVQDEAVVDRRVQVMTTMTTPLFAVLRFHSTMVMNILTASHLICLYPGLTFVAKKFLPLTPIDGLGGNVSIESAYRKYEGRGFERITFVDWTTVFDRRKELTASVRNVADGLCLTVRLHPVDENESKEIWHAVFPTVNEITDMSANSWRLEYSGMKRTHVLTTALISIDRKQYCVPYEVLSNLSLLPGMSSAIPIARHSMDISSALRTYYGYQGSETLEHYLFRSFQRFATGNDVEIHKAQGFEMHSAHAMQFLYQQLVKCLRDIDYNDWPMLDIRVRISAGETWLDISMILGSRLAFEIVRDLIMHAETVYGLMKLRITVSLGFV